MRSRLVALLACSGLAGGLPGCVSLKRTPEARFFVLRSLLEPATPAPAGASAAVVGMLPVLMPSYLDRPQVVTWAAPGELRIDEFMRWAEPLDAGISRTLAENLDALLPGHSLVRSPWPAGLRLRCRIRVELQQFGPQTSGELRLEGGWAVLPQREEQPLVARSVDLRRAPPASAARPADVGAAVEAMSELLADLAREIAAAVRELPADAQQGG